jgi:hypothetical protein
MSMLLSDNPSALCQFFFDKLRIKFEKGNTSNENSFNENLVDQSRKKKVNCFYCKKPQHKIKDYKT